MISRSYAYSLLQHNSANVAGAGARDAQNASALGHASNGGNSGANSVMGHRGGGHQADNPNMIDVGYDTDTIANFEIDKAFTDYLLCQICFSKSKAVLLTKVLSFLQKCQEMRKSVTIATSCIASCALRIGL